MLRQKNMKYIACLFITVLIFALGACGGGSSAPLTIGDLEDIGFKKERNTTATYEYQIVEAWDGEITVNGATEFLEVLIFPDAPDDFTKEQWEMLTMAFNTRSLIINNLAIACSTQETCDYVKDNLP